MKTEPESPSVSALRSRNECWETDSFTAALSAFTDDGREYQLSYSQYLYLVRCANPELENDPKAARERIEIQFSTGVVVVLGNHLQQMAGYVRKCELSVIRRGSYLMNKPAETGQTQIQIRIHSITVILKEDL